MEIWYSFKDYQLRGFARGKIDLEKEYNNVYNLFDYNSKQLSIQKVLWIPNLLVDKILICA